jgi:NADH-quinone oxidoreductase subunit C
MDEKLQPAVQAIQSRFQAGLSEFRDEVTLQVQKADLQQIATTLRDEFGFNMLVDITAVDYWPEESPRFHVVIHLLRTTTHQVLCLRVPVNAAEPLAPTLDKIYPNATWYEREVWDLFGIRFEGNFDMRRIVMPADWEGHPLRKDYPLGYEEVQFTFNYDEISLHKTAPKK